MRPTINAIPFEDQPVLLRNVAKTNLAFSCEGAVAGTVMRMTAKEINVVYRESVARCGSVLP